MSLRPCFGWFWVWAALLSPLCATPRTRQEKELQPLEAHIASATEELVYIDMGLDRGLQAGDRVTIYPEGKPSLQAVVHSATRHYARLEFFEPTPSLAPGTRCDVFRKKHEGPGFRLDSGSSSLLEPEAARPVPDHPPWSRAPEDWPSGGALLAEAQPITARERPLDWDAHWSLSGTFTDSNLVERRQSYSARTNFGWAARNPFERGGELEFDASSYTRSSDGGDGFEEQHSSLRLNYLSYILGGRREEPTRYEFGRFVPQETPEFGRLDGFSVDHRLKGGRQVGFSAGHVPGWTDASEFGDDWQLAWIFQSGLSERRGLDWRTAYQKTFHQGRSDRDLLLLGSRWSPRLGDSVSATAWVDWYDGDDGPKDVGPELTRLQWFASHTLSPGSGLRISHTRSRVPFVLRQTYDTPAEDLNLDGVVERTGLSHWRMLDRDHRLNARLDYWRDEQGEGLHGELGHEWLGLLSRGGDLEAALSASDGSFSELLSLRLGVRTFHEGNYWQVSWQTTRLVETTDVGSRDALWQHDVRASLNRQVLGGWNFSLNLDLGLGDDQDHRALGFHLGRRF